MTRDLGSIDAGLVGASFGIGGPTPPARDEQVNIFALAHKLLRGRYLMAIVGGLAGGVGGALLGYFSQKPLYQSEGYVRIRSFMQSVMGPIPENDPIYNIQTVLATHASYLKQQRVLDKAVGGQQWLALGRPRGPGAVKAFSNSVTVATSPVNNEQITVAFSDKDPRAAKIGLEELLTAYEDLYAEGETRREREKTIAVLEERKRAVGTQIQDLRARIQEESKDVGTDDLGKILDKRNDYQLTLDQEVLKLENQLAERGGQPLKPGEVGKAPGTGSGALTPEEIAAGDEEMRKLVEDRIFLANQLSSLRVRYTKEHREVKGAERAIAENQKRIEDRALAWNQSGKGPAIVARPGTQQIETVAQLQTRLATKTKEADQHRAETSPIARKRVLLDSLKRDLDEATTMAKDVRTRLDSLTTEAKGQEVIGRRRIEVTKPTTIPSIPSIDRRKKYAMLGLVVGGGFPVLLVGLLGLFDGRMRFTYADQAREPGTNLPLLGILPQLPKDLADPEQAAAVAHCVHQMRTLLQIGGEQRKVYAITSSTAGDGKTSLALSLGLSFAASGSRTLLVDFDLVGHGLSSSLKVRPVHGIASALLSGDAVPVVTPTGIDRLWLLPAARDDDRFVSRLSEHMVKAFIDGLRASYDVILIDTGPVLGSLEANFVSSSADAVVLVVGRGQQRVHVQRAIEQLNTLRARILGMVFNRADSADFMKSATSASFRSVRDEPSSPAPPPSEQINELEPVARTVAMDVRR